MTPRVYAGSASLIAQGTAKTLLSVAEIPRTMVEHSAKVMFPLGLATGAVVGALRTVTGTLSGVLDITRGALPLAKYAAFFI